MVVSYSDVQRESKWPIWAVKLLATSDHCLLKRQYSLMASTDSFRDGLRQGIALGEASTLNGKVGATIDEFAQSVRVNKGTLFEKFSLPLVQGIPFIASVGQ